MKRTRLKRSKGLKRSGGPKGRGKAARKPTEAATARKREKKRARSVRLFGPPGFAEWMRMRPCRKCGRVPTKAWPNEIHHDPPEGTGKRGHWTMTSTLCSDCHTRHPESRHEHPGGHVGFWAEIGTTREDVAAEVQRLWLSEGGAA